MNEIIICQTFQTVLKYFLEWKLVYCVRNSNDNAKLYNLKRLKNRISIASLCDNTLIECKDDKQNIYGANVILLYIAHIYIFFYFVFWVYSPENKIS